MDQLEKTARLTAAVETFARDDGYHWTYSDGFYAVRDCGEVVLLAPVARCDARERLGLGPGTGQSESLAVLKGQLAEAWGIAGGMADEMNAIRREAVGDDDVDPDESTKHAVRRLWQERDLVRHNIRALERSIDEYLMDDECGHYGDRVGEGEVYGLEECRRCETERLRRGAECVVVEPPKPEPASDTDEPDTKWWTVDQQELDERLHYRTLDVAMHAFLESLGDGVEPPETVEAIGYAPLTPHLHEGQTLNEILLHLDEEYGDPDEDCYEPTERMLEAERRFHAVVLAEYDSWACDPVVWKTVNVAEWLRGRDESNAGTEAG